jgi:hypothetical protein
VGSHASPLIFVDPALGLRIRKGRWDALLRAYGVTLAMDPRTAPLRELLRALWGVRADARFAEAVDVLGVLACDVGHAAIVTAARQEKRKLPTELDPADLAAELLTRRAHDESWEPVLEMALLKFTRLAPDAVAFERRGRDGRAAGDASGCAEVIRSQLGGEVVDAWHGVDDDGVIHVAVLRREGRRSAAVACATGAARVVRRSLVADVVRVDVPEARCVARTNDEDRARAYASALGDALYGDARFFSDAPTFTLGPLTRLGSARLARVQVPGISRVRVVEIVWDNGKGATFYTQGSDALFAYETSGGASGGYILSAMLRMDSPASPRPIDVVIHLANRAAFREPRLERLARAALHALGLDAPGTAPDDAFSLAPWIHAEWRWRRLLGDAAFERLCAQGILVPAKARMVAGRPEEKLGWVYVEFPLKSRPGTRYAVARDPSLPSRVVAEGDQRMWTLDRAALAELHARELGAESGSAETRERIAEGVIDVGLVRGRGADVHVWLVLRAPATAAESRAWVAAVQRASRGAHPVVVLPEGRTIGAAVEIGVTSAELFGAEEVAPKVLERAGEALGVEGMFEPSRLVAKDVRLVCDGESERCWLDGVELTHLSDVGAKMVVTLSKDARVVPSKEVETAMSPKRTARGAASETAAKIGEWIRRSFADAGREAPGDAGEIVVAVGKRGWRVTVKAAVR